MNGYIKSIKSIKTKIPYSTREVCIEVEGKNIIFTGGNGGGKTQLLNFLYQILEKQMALLHLPWSPTY